MQSSPELFRGTCRELLISGKNGITGRFSEGRRILLLFSVPLLDCTRASRETEKNPMEIGNKLKREKRICAML